MRNQSRALVTGFYRAIERSDYAALLSEFYSADATIWHNTDNKNETAEENVAALKGVGTVAQKMQYDLTRAFDFDGGVVQQATVNFTLNNGKHASLYTCGIFWVENGRIVRLEEYYDGLSLQAMVAGATEN